MGFSYQLPAKIWGLTQQHLDLFGVLCKTTKPFTYFNQICTEQKLENKMKVFNIKIYFLLIESKKIFNMKNILSAKNNATTEKDWKYCDN